MEKSKIARLYGTCWLVVSIFNPSNAEKGIHPPKFIPPSFEDVVLNTDVIVVGKVAFLKDSAVSIEVLESWKHMRKGFIVADTSSSWAEDFPGDKNEQGAVFFLDRIGDHLRIEFAMPVILALRNNIKYVDIGHAMEWPNGEAIMTGDRTSIALADLKDAVRKILASRIKAP